MQAEHEMPRLFINAQSSGAAVNRGRTPAGESHTYHHLSGRNCGSHLTEPTITHADGMLVLTMARTTLRATSNKGGSNQFDSCKQDKWLIIS